MKHKTKNQKPCLSGRQAKTKNHIYAVILAGGAGQRLWPASRIKSPKYDMKVLGSRTIIQETVARLRGFIPRYNILPVTTKDQVEVIKKNLRKKGIKNFLIEPFSRNTAVAIGLAAIYIKKKNPNAIMIVLPADHYIRDAKAFKVVIRNAARVAQRGYLVTLGIKPTFPSTGYGYIKIKNPALPAGRQKSKIKKRAYYEVEKFVEKPDRNTAEEFLKSNIFFWNTGIFAWDVNTILDSIRCYMPSLYRSLSKMEKFLDSPRFERDISNIYKRIKNISIDYGVMEKAKNKAVVLARFDWTDLGSWLSLEQIYKSDKDKNIYKGLKISHGTKGSIIFGPKDHLIATCGVENLVIVHTKDATLIANKYMAQDVKRLVELIRKKGLKKYL